MKRETQKETVKEIILALMESYQISIEDLKE